MALVIVESPNKIKTIKKYLKQIGEDLKDDMIKNASVLASVGHIRNVSNNFNKDDYIVAGIKNNYNIEYDLTETKMNVISDIRKSAKTAKVIWLASDMDREGEAIASSLIDVIGKHNYKRCAFNEITLPALKNAFAKPVKLNKDLVDAQKSRQILDKVIGYKLSQFLWNFISYDKFNPISAGRVQSAVLSLIADKQKEIEKVSDENYWKPNADFKIKGITQQLNNCEILELDKDSGKYNKCILDDESEVKNFWKKYKKEALYIPSYKVSTSTTNPPKPYMTSTLLRDASSKLGMSLDKTTKLAQNLYEAGLITYIRTDHAVISDEFKPKIRDFILETFDDTYFNNESMKSEEEKKKSEKKKKTDKKNDDTAQEAHECIRPTDLSIDIDAISDNNIQSSHKSLYNLIKKTTIASMMTPALYDVFTINIHTSNDKYMSKSQLKGIKFKGFKILDDVIKSTKKSKKNKDDENDNYGNDDNIDDDKSIDIDKLKGIIDKCINDKKTDCVKVLKIILNHIYEKPPSHYTKVGLVDLMKNTGLGRPSTYLNLTNVLFDRSYCNEMNVNGPEKEFISYEWKSTKPNDIKESKILAPLYTRKNVIQITERGKKVNEILIKDFKDLINVDFTSHMESSLNEIAEGELKYLDYVKSICDTFIEKYDELLEKYQNDNGKIKKTVIGREKVSLEFDGINYDLMVDKFGNDTLTYEEHDGVRKYINIGNYLKYSHKNVRELELDDIQLLKNLPIKVNKYITIKIGKFGLYVDDTKKNTKYPIYLKYLPNVIKGDYTIFTDKK